MKTKLLLLLFFIKLSSFAQNVPSYAPLNGLIAYYPFNGNANDNSGNKANGTILNATLTTDRFGNANSAYSFNGVDSFINAVIPNIPQGNSSRTISGWFKTDDVFSDSKKFDACIFNYGALENLQRLSLSLYSKGYLNIITGPDSFFSNDNFYADNLNYADNQWYFFTLTYDGNNVSIYVNGQFLNKQGIKLNTTNNIFRIGQRLPDNKNEVFKGKIDDIGIWSRVLTQEEITGLYEAGNPDNLYTLIPDSNFEKKLIALGIDSGSVDGKVLTTKISHVINLDVSSSLITDLSGIQDFTSLNTLICNSNSLTSIDLSHNLKLNNLDAANNQLSSINITGNSYLSVCNLLNNKLLSLELPKTNYLNTLLVDKNQLGSLDTSGNIQLTQLNCNYNNLTSLDLSKNVNLTSLYADGNKFTTLNISKNTALQTVWCGENQLTTITLPESNKLTTLFLNANRFTSLDISKYTALKEFVCSTNQLTSIDVSKNTELTFFHCHENKLTNLNISNNKALTSLFCHENQLQTLNVSQNTALKFLWCYGNQIINLDLSKNKALTILACHRNKFTSLNIKNGNNINLDLDKYGFTNNPELTCIQVDDVNFANKYWADQKDAVASFNTLCEPVYTAIPDSNFEQKLINLGIDTDGLNGKITISNASTITSLDLSNSNIKDLTGIENFTALNILDCSNNQLTTLDLSKNSNLQILYVTGNPLVYLNLKNGNNQNLIVESQSGKKAVNIPGTSFLGLINLGCVKVDSAPYSNANWSRIKEATTTYSETCTLGLEDSILDKIVIYPNPTKGEITINNASLEKATVYNSLGQLVKTFVLDSSNTINTINLSGLPKGIYYIYLINQDAASAKKVIVE